MQYVDNILNFLYLLVAGITGAISSLTFVPYREMNVRDIALTVFAGCTFAIFVAPSFAIQVAGVDPLNSQLISAYGYLFGIGANVLIPVMLRRLKRSIGGTGDTSHE